MPLTSPGAVRSAGRKAANSLRSNHPNGGATHNGSRTLHTARSQLSNAHPSEVAHKFINSLDAIRPRTPAHTLFSSTKGFVANLFNRLASPGIRVPPLGSSFVSRSLVQARPITIQAGLSLPAKHAIRNNNFRSLGSGTFLPRAPQAPLRGHVASQVGLGTARNFSTARPIFQNLVDNVPVAVRALYEADLDDLKNGRYKRTGPRKIPVKVKKAKTSVKGSKLKAKSTIVVPLKTVDEEKSFDSAELERYFPTPSLPAATTELLIPLAPAPSNRVPLSALEDQLEASMGTGRFLPLPRIGQMHQSHSIHALKVSTLFARLDQANVWSRGGVVCSAYSGPGAGAIRERRRGAASEDSIKLIAGAIDLAELEGTCTMLKIEFQGWTAGEVRGVIGESGKGWCSLEEVWNDEEDDNSSLFADSLSGMSTPAFFSPPPSRPAGVAFDMGMPEIDPAQSFILPTLDFSSPLPSDTNERRAFAGGGTPPPEATPLQFDDPWAEFENSSSSSSDLEDGYMSCSSLSPPLSRSSSFGSFEGVVVAPRLYATSESSWSRLESDVEPREALF